MKKPLKERIGFACLVAVTLASLGLNVWQAREELRDRAIIWLNPDQPVIRIETDPATKRVVEMMVELRTHVDDGLRENDNKSKALREYVDNFIDKRSQDIRYDLDQTRDQVKAIDARSSALGTAFKSVVGEHIRREQLPKEFSTIY